MKGISALGFFTVASCVCGSVPNPGEGETFSTGGIVIPPDTDSTSGIGTITSSDGSNDIKLDVEFNDLPEQECVDVALQVEPVIPTMVLLIDQSGSMDLDFGGQTRWDAVYTTLMDPSSGVIAVKESSISFGLALYTGTMGMCPQTIEVPPALNNYNTIDAVYSMEAPLSETPTGESLDQVAMSLAALPGNEPRAIVLATDGEPDTCEDPGGGGQSEAIAAAQTAWISGIQTFILSVGGGLSLTHLQEMANAGVGKPVDEMSNPEPFYVALNPQEMVDAFDAIIASFVSCTFKLDGEIIGDPCAGEVLLDGTPLECGAEWNAISPSTIELFGSTCESIKDGEMHNIEAVFPCNVVTAP